jgi:acyl-CoA thioesterase-1
MEAPPNLGTSYTSRFHAVYPALAKKYDAALVPFLLAGVAGQRALNQDDGMHPTVAGHRVVADNVWSVLRPVLVSRAKTPG